MGQEVTPRAVKPTVARAGARGRRLLAALMGGLEAIDSFWRIARVVACRDVTLAAIVVNVSQILEDGGVGESERCSRGRNVRLEKAFLLLHSRVFLCRASGMLLVVA